MAQQMTVTMVDDLDGTADGDVQSVTFGLDGVTYEIDLNQTNATELRDRVSRFISAGRRTGGRLKRGTAAAPALRRDPEQTRAIRAWAIREGFDVAERGRIPADVLAAFDAAQAAPPTATTKKTKAAQAKR